MSSLVLNTSANPGAADWLDSASLPGGASSGILAELDKAQMAPDLGETTDAAAIGSNGETKTLTFTAPVDLTVKKFIFMPTFVDTATTAAQYVSNNAMQIGINAMSVTGYDSSATLFEGNAASAACFMVNNLPLVPDLNIRMNAGDVLTVELINITSTTPLSFNCFFTYDEGIDTTVSPVRILGGSGVSFGVLLGSTNTSATGTLTVEQTPLTGPPTITFRELDGDLRTLSPAGGARTPGSNDYDDTVTGITAIRDEILAALNDGANDFLTDYTFASSGSDAITVTPKTTGAFTNFYTIGSTDVADVSVVDFAGATSPQVTLGAVSPSTDLTITHIFLTDIVDSTIPLSAYRPGLELVSLDVDSSPAAVGRTAGQPNAGLITLQKPNLAVSAGATVELQLRFSGPGTYTAGACMIATPG